MADTVAAWKKSKIHPDVLLPSGARVDVKIVDLPKMVTTGKIPQHLLDVAVAAAKGGDDVAPTEQMLKDQIEFTNLLVMETVVAPKLSLDDLEDLPYEDKEMLVSIATRQRDLDAEGKHIAGLDKSERWRRFRGLTDLDSDVEGL